MFCHLNFPIDKENLRNYFFDNFEKAKHHKTAKSEIHYWLKLFEMNDEANRIINELGLSDLNVSPRFSFQKKNTMLFQHIDIDRIVGINFNLLEEGKATIHMNNVGYSYEAALIDVGSVKHKVVSVPWDRLVLKLAVREPWEKVYSIFSERGFLKTRCDEYVSNLTEPHWVKL